MLKKFFSHRPKIKHVKHIRKYVNMNGWEFRDIVKFIIMGVI